MHEISPAKSDIPPEMLAELDEAIGLAIQGTRDPEVMQRACDEQDRLREETRQRTGEIDVAVDLISEGRDEE